MTVKRVSITAGESSAQIGSSLLKRLFNKFWFEFTANSFVPGAFQNVTICNDLQNHYFCKYL